jgi:hypothetical protein
MWFRSVVIAMAAGAVAGLSGCAGGPRLAVPVSQAGSDRLQIFWVKAHAVRDGIEVGGRVRRQPLYVGVIGGHLHVEGRFADGRPPVVTDTRWGGLPSRGSTSASFGAILRTDRPADIVAIRVEHRLRDDEG